MSRVGDSSAAAWEAATIAEAEAYAQQEAEEAAAERDRREAGAANQPGDGFEFSPGGASSSGLRVGADGRVVGSDGRPLSPGEQTFFVKVPPEDVNAYLEGGYPLVSDGGGGWYLDTRSTASHDFVEQGAPPPTHWLPEYGGQGPTAGTPPDASPWPPSPEWDPPIESSIIQADDLSPKGLLELGAAFLAGIVKHLGKEATEKALKEAVESGATNAVDGLRLGKHLASEAGMAELLSGGGKVIAGAGAKREIDDVARLVAQYGGEPSDWAKVTSEAHKLPDGSIISVHGYRNVVTGQTVEPKTKIDVSL
jgi:hypothetical protein